MSIRHIKTLLGLNGWNYVKSTVSIQTLRHPSKSILVPLDGDVGLFRMYITLLYVAKHLNNVAEYSYFVH